MAEEDTASKEDKIKYEVIFEGLDNVMLKSLLKKVSGLNNDEDYVPFSTNILEGRAKEELTQLLGALHSRGYYDAILNVELNTDKTPVEVVYHVNTGERYKISDSRISLINNTRENINLPDKKKYRIDMKPAETSRLNETAEDLSEYIKNNNCFLSVKVIPALELNREQNNAEAVFEVETGPEAKFGQTTVTGNKRVNREYINKFIPWKQGGCFKQSQITKAQSGLMQSQLFSTVDIKYPDQTDENGEVPVTAELTERFRRTIKFGLSFKTDEGAGANSSWENRNFFGGGEKLDARAQLSSIESSAETNYTEPFFFHPDQSLKLGARIARETPDQYTSKNMSVRAGVERVLNKNITAGLGTGYRYSEVESIDGQDTYGLIFVPGYGIWDSRDNLIDPKKGLALRVDAAPYFDTLGGTDAGFFRSIGRGSTYFSFPGKIEPVMMLRGAVGSIGASSTRAVPADLRLYAGGGSSVRGYGYQDLSPLKSGIPVGGRSLLELSSEFRFKVTKSIGGAIFVDGGNAFEEIYPDFGNGIRWGSGIGARYYSDIGIIRVDVAVPLDKREGDSSYQLYVSVGETF